MGEPAILLNKRNWAEIDARVRRVDEDRWLSSRYAPVDGRRALIALYAFNYELARVRGMVSEAPLGSIRFQWWRDALEELAAGAGPRRHEVVEALAETRPPLDALQRLIDAHEEAFDAKDRSKEPEGALARLAAQTLDAEAAANWPNLPEALGESFAAARRGDAAPHDCAKVAAPVSLRPAVAHAALRTDYAAGREPGPLRKRVKILRAVLSGSV